MKVCPLLLIGHPAQEGHLVTRGDTAWKASVQSSQVMGRDKQGMQRSDWAFEMGR